MVQVSKTVNGELNQLFDKAAEAYRKKSFVESVKLFRIYANQSSDKLLVAMALNNIGEAYFDMRRPRIALRYYDRAIKKEPDYSTPYFNKADTLNELKRFSEALAIYKILTERAPEDAHGYWGVGNCFSALGDELRALDSYKEALKRSRSWQRGALA